MKLATHYLAEYMDCSRDRIDDVAYIEQLMLSICEELGVTVVNSCFHQFSPQGVSGVVVIAESHLSIHTWPEYGFVSIDFFTCGGQDPESVFTVLQEKFRAGRWLGSSIDRGDVSTHFVTRIGKR